MISGVVLLWLSLQSDLHQRNAAVLNGLQQLHAISLKKLRGENRRVQIANLNADVAKIVRPLSAAQSAQLALAARAMISGRAEHQDIDEVYWTAFWSSARKLAADPSAAAAEALKRVSERSGIDDGGDLLMMRELLAKQARQRRR